MLGLADKMASARAPVGAVATRPLIRVDGIQELLFGVIETFCERSLLQLLLSVAELCVATFRERCRVVSKYVSLPSLRVSDTC